MRVLVCGGRKFANQTKVYMELDILKPTEIICGMAPGADMLAAKYAYFKHIPILKFPADWNRYGRAAGFIRNRQMLDEGKPDLVLAFPGGVGTAMMVMLASAQKFRIVEIDRISTTLYQIGT